MKRILIIILFIPLFGQGQHLGPYIKYYNLKSVNKKIDKIIKGGEPIGIVYKLDILNDTLYFSESTDTLETKVKVTFNSKWDYCDYQEVVTSCSSCAKKRKDQLFKVMKWYKISETKYLSKYWRSIELEIIEDTSNSYCSIIRFKYFNMTRKEYKELKNKNRYD